MAYTGRLRPTGVFFSGLRYMISLVEVYTQRGRENPSVHLPEDLNGLTEEFMASTKFLLL